MVKSLNLLTKFKALSSKDSRRRFEVRDEEETAGGGRGVRTSNRVAEG
jgi:hypothetical protein